MTKKTGWIATAIMAPIIAGVIVDRLKVVDFSSKIKSVYGWFITFLARDFGVSFSIGGWLLLFTVVLVLYFLAKAIYKKIKTNDPYEYYKNDNFLGISWSWDYYLREVIENTLQPLCPDCEFELQPYRASTFVAVNHVGYVCQNCGWKKEMKATQSEVIGRVIKSIEHNIRKRQNKNS